MLSSSRIASNSCYPMANTRPCCNSRAWEQKPEGRFVEIAGAPVVEITRHRIWQSPNDVHSHQISDPSSRAPSTDNQRRRIFPVVYCHGVLPMRSRARKTQTSIGLLRAKTTVHTTMIVFGPSHNSESEVRTAASPESSLTIAGPKY